MTSMSAPPSEWERLDNVHYHRRHLYSFTDVRVDGRNCAAAVNGGAFAVRSSAEKSANAAADSTRHAQQFTVYSASGVHLCDIAYQSSCELVAHGWTGEELLVCVHGDGRVVVHDLGGRKVRDARLSFSRREDEEKAALEEAPRSFVARSGEAGSSPRRARAPCSWWRTCTRKRRESRGRKRTRARAAPFRRCTRARHAGGHGGGDLRARRLGLRRARARRSVAAFRGRGARPAVRESERPVSDRLHQSGKDAGGDGGPLRDGDRV